jgi:hypothetical protein
MENTSLVVAAPATRQPVAAGTLSAFSSEQSFVAAQRMATALCSSTLVPEAYRGTANLGNALIALELSHRIGASVMAVMQSMTPIHGRPSWSAAFLIATVNTCGRFTPLRFRWQGQEGTDAWGCRAVAKERDSGEELVGSLITIALAKAEGWYGRAGSKWKTMPEQMLTYRAAAFWTRAYAPELSLGMVTSEEANDLAAVERRRGTVESVREQVAAIPTPAPVATVVVESTPVTHPVWGEQRLDTAPPQPEQAVEVAAEPVAVAPEPDPAPTTAPTQPVSGVPETVEDVLKLCGITYKELVWLAVENAWYGKADEYTEVKWLPVEVVSWILRNHRGIARAAKKMLAAKKPEGV